MDNNISTNLLKQRIGARLKELGNSSICAAGSLVRIKRKCGSPKCQCAQGGEKHPAHLLTSKVKGKTKAVYVPVEMVEEVRGWIEEYRKIKTILKEINSMSEQIIRQHVQENRAVAKNKKLLNQ